jgi:hypothetical protein
MKAVLAILFGLFLGLLSLLIAPAAHAAELEAQFGLDRVRIGEAPCTDGAVSAHETSEAFADMHAGYADVGGKRYQACWHVLPDGRVRLRYDDGDQGLIPVQLFAPAKDV